MHGQPNIKPKLNSVDGHRQNYHLVTEEPSSLTDVMCYKSVYRFSFIVSGVIIIGNTGVKPDKQLLD
jgi:hypothetical protein